MQVEEFVKRANELTSLADEVLATAWFANHKQHVNAERFNEFRSSSLSFLATTFGASHQFARDFQDRVTHSRSSCAMAGRGILVAAREELSRGWFQTARGIISAEIFADFLGMAEHLLDQDYKDAAAVIAGSVLEEHLRQLAEKALLPVSEQRHGKDVARKADTLNADLAKAGLYSKLDQKSVMAWLSLRNEAAHGHYAKYTREQVVLMLQGVGNFMARVAV